MAAVGNDGCDCVQVPAAVPSVPAVGGCTELGEPLPTNNWGSSYRADGILAPGEDISGARPGAGTIALTGSSFAVPVVTCAAAALIAVPRRSGADAAPTAIKNALLSMAAGATPAGPTSRRHLAGVLDLHQAIDSPNRNEGSMDTTETTWPALSGVTAASAGHLEPGTTARVTARWRHRGVRGRGVAATLPPPAAAAGSSCTSVVAPVAPQYIYAIGTIGWDFGTEARRDGFVQQMDVTDGAGGTLLPASRTTRSSCRATWPRIRGRPTS